MAYEYTRQEYLYEDMCTLIKYEKQLDENLVPRDVIVSQKDVFCKVGSVYQKEFFYAYEHGLTSQWQLIVYAPDYNDEMTVRFNGREYQIYRRFFTANDEVELFLRADKGNTA